MISSSCKPFEKNPFISNLAGSKTSVSGQIRSLISVVGSEKIDVVRPYLSIKNATKQTGEIYFEITSDSSVAEIQRYNDQLDQRRIDNPGTNSDFISIDSFTKQVNLPDYDVIFVDECSTIDNRTMGRFLSKMSPDTFLVLAGDIHQIE